MRRFPGRETDIAALAADLIFGLGEHADDFPAPPVSIEELQTLLDAYTRAHEVTVSAQGAAAEATLEKDAVLEELTDAMKGVLQYAEHAVESNDAKLRNIGWRGRKTPGALQPPGAPRTLEVKREGPGWIYLDWKSPADGGAVAKYLVYTRPKNEGGDWVLGTSCYDSLAVLTDQPKGVEIEFHVVAENKAGVSIPSNFVTATL